MADKDELSRLLECTLNKGDFAAYGDSEDRRGTGSRVSNLRRLSGGASMETWAFSWGGDEVESLIVRCRPTEANSHSDTAGGIEMGQISLEMEAQLLAVLRDHGVRVPRHVCDLPLNNDLVIGYVMSQESGEALPTKILRDPRFATARETLAYKCGQELAKIHSVPNAALPPGLEDISIGQRLDKFQEMSDRFGNVSPVHQLAINWLRENQPESAARCLLHGDFRNGNLLVDETGLSSILDWELAHIGHPEEDLGYLCSNVWRFGVPNRPVGGFGDYQQLLAGYQEVAGWAPNLKTLKYWELFAALSWGMVCLLMEDVYHSGVDRSFERLAIGRRLSESEVDILLLLDKLQGYQTVPASEDPNTTDDAFQAARPTSLIEGVAEYLKNELVPQLDAYSAYTTRVAINSLKIAARDVQSLGQLTHLDELIAEHLGLAYENNPTASVCHHMRTSNDYSDSELIGLLKRRTLIAMQVDNPKYWGYLEAKRKW
ncbi:MAG: phosphotransferase [Pseudomonadota bacterium]